VVWERVRERRGLGFFLAAVVALGAYGFVATLQPFQHFGRIRPPAAACSSPVAGLGAWPSMASGQTATT
jgi:small multidrug resistance family-3 protein